MSEPPYTNYTINVAKQIKEKIGQTWGPFYEHYFTTEASGIRDRNKADAVYAELCEKFPYPQYHVSMDGRMQGGAQLASNGKLS